MFNILVNMDWRSLKVSASRTYRNPIVFMRDRAVSRMKDDPFAVYVVPDDDIIVREQCSLRVLQRLEDIGVISIKKTRDKNYGPNAVIEEVYIADALLRELEKSE